MSVLGRIAHHPNRPDELANRQWARDLARKKDRRDIQEIAGNPWNKDRSNRADCIKVLYETGNIDPARVAQLRPEVVPAHLGEIKRAMEIGSVITVENAVQALARACSAGEKYRRAMFPLLVSHLKTCRPKDVPQQLERVLVAVNSANQQQFVAALNGRLEDPSGSGLARARKVLQRAENI